MDDGLDQTKLCVHNWVFIASSIWMCKVCFDYMWMPEFGDAQKYSDMIRKYGKKKAYELALRARPGIAKTLDMLNSVKWKSDNVSTT